MERKTQGGIGALQKPLVCNHVEPKMKSLTRMNMVVIKDYYDMIPMDENVNWMTPTNLLSSFSLTLQLPCVHLPKLHSSKKPFWMYALEKNTISLPYEHCVC